MLLYKIFLRKVLLKKVFRSLLVPNLVLSFHSLAKKLGYQMRWLIFTHRIRFYLAYEFSALNHDPCNKFKKKDYCFKLFSELVCHMVYYFFLNIKRVQKYHLCIDIIIRQCYMFQYIFINSKQIKYKCLIGILLK